MNDEDRLSLRAYLAGCALSDLATLMAGASVGAIGSYPLERIAKRAVEIADATIKELEK